MISNPQDELQAQQAIEGELLDGEKILWTGQPDPSKIFTAADLFLIPFALFWISMPTMGGVSMLKDGDFSGALFIVPFLLIGSYLLVGRFFYKSWAKRKTYYAVTDRRVIVINGGLKHRIAASFIRDIVAVNSSINKNGEGMVIFGNASIFAASFGNSGFGTAENQTAPLPPIFYDLKNAQEVLDLVNRLRNEQCR